MKFRYGKSFLWMALATAGFAAAPVEPVPGPPPPDVAGLIPKLSDESYAVREAATREIWKLGDAVLPQLRTLAAGRDPEAAIRARDLLRKIELGILPDSSPKIVDLVMHYDRGTLDERQRVIYELRNERAYRQILKLYALEKDEDALAMLESSVRGVAIEAARDCLVAEPPDVRGAFTYLKMARPEASDFMAMASLHRVLGTLDEELAKAKDTEGPGAHLWRYALLACAGRLPEAAAEAEQAGLSQASARLHLISGDPVPWLREAPVQPQSVPPLGLPDYRQFAVAAWEGKNSNPELIRKFRSAARSGDEEDQAKGMMMLFLTGDHAEAEKILLRRDPAAAFYYLDSAERVDEALKTLDIDPAEPDYTDWARKRFDVLIDDPDSEDREVQELSLLGYFLEHRGLYGPLEEAFVPPLMELADENRDSFLLCVSRLFGHEEQDLLTLTVVRPILKACSEFAGKDELRWAQVIEHLFDSRRNSADIWHQLATIYPEQTPADRLSLMARIFGQLQDPDGDVSRFYADSWKAIEKADPGDHRRLYQQLSETCEPGALSKDPYRGDMGIYVDCVEKLEQLDGTAGSMKLKKAHFQAVTGRWEKAAKSWLELGADMPGEPIYWGYAAACMHRAGMTSKAGELERKAELLAMGETSALAQIGYYFALTGDFKKAGDWWRRAARECTSESRMFGDVVDYLANDANAREDWKLSAALSEARTLSFAMAGRSSSVLSAEFLRQRLESDMMRAFAGLDTDRERSVATIEKSLEAPFSDLLLADYFFAPLRRAGMVKLHDEAFEKSWKRLSAVIARFPDGENVRNSAAWLASRANRRLDEAEAHSAHALKTSPLQAAYLDTLAEVLFARGDRAKAVELSSKGLKQEPGDLQLLRQHERFEKGDFPPK